MLANSTSNIVNNSVTSCNQNSVACSTYNTAKKRVSFGCRKIPRFLYHLTQSGKLEYIEKYGIRQSKAEEDNYITGVYLFDLKNLVRNWDSISLNGEDDLRMALIKHVMKAYSQLNLALLKIPTANLDPNALVLRRLHKLFEAQNSKEFDRVESHLRITGEVLPNNFEHVFNGAPAADARLYTNEPIEYIYKGPVDMANAEVVNCAYIDRNSMTPQEIYGRLLAGKPESASLKSY